MQCSNTCNFTSPQQLSYCLYDRNHNNSFPFYTPVSWSLSKHYVVCCVFLHQIMLSPVKSISCYSTLPHRTSTKQYPLTLFPVNTLTSLQVFPIISSSSSHLTALHNLNIQDYTTWFHKLFQYLRFGFWNIQLVQQGINIAEIPQIVC